MSLQASVSLNGARVAECAWYCSRFLKKNSPSPWSEEMFHLHNYLYYY